MRVVRRLHLPSLDEFNRCISERQGHGASMRTGRAVFHSRIHAPYAAAQNRRRRLAPRTLRSSSPGNFSGSRSGAGAGSLVGSETGTTGLSGGTGRAGGVVGGMAWSRCLRDRPRCNVCARSRSFSDRSRFSSRSCLPAYGISPSPVTMGMFLQRLKSKTTMFGLPLGVAHAWKLCLRHGTAIATAQHVARPLPAAVRSMK